MNLALNIKKTLTTQQLMLLMFIVAVLFRSIGINYGYWHGDERVNDAAKVLTGQLVPGQHFYPPLWNYINAVAYAIVYIVGRFNSFLALHQRFSFALFFRSYRLLSDLPHYNRTFQFTKYICSLCGLKVSELELARNCYRSDCFRSDSGNGLSFSYSQK